jgi:hypothetical protein
MGHDDMDSRVTSLSFCKDSQEREYCPSVARRRSKSKLTIPERASALPAKRMDNMLFHSWAVVFLIDT